MLSGFMLALTLITIPPAGQSWSYDGEPAPRPTPAPTPAPPFTPIILPTPDPVRPAPARPVAPPVAPKETVKETAEERRPTAEPGPPIGELQAKRTIRKVCDKPARWRLTDATGKVWVAYDRTALITHVQTVNAAILVPTPIETVTTVVEPAVLAPAPIVTTPVSVFSTPVTTWETPSYWQVDTWSSSPRITPHTIVAPSFAAPVRGGCAGGRCR